MTDAFESDFERLTTNDDHVLLYDGQPFDPTIELNGRLEIIDTFNLISEDVALVGDIAGFAQPARYCFVSVSKDYVMATAVFGTGTDLITVKEGPDFISVTMPGFCGRYEPEEEQLRAREAVHVFLYRGGILTENGRVIE